MGLWKKDHHGQMDYFIYLPNSPTPSQKQSLMINLHGCGQQSEALRSAGNWDMTADLENMVVVIPQVPNGGVVMGCWDYYGPNHDGSHRHDQEVISLIEDLLVSPDLNIDSKSVYISGLSSGGGEAAVVGCLRPDLIAGIGLSSSPALGSLQSELQKPNSSPGEMLDLCMKLAGPYLKHFETQISAIITGDQDFIVNPAHSRLNRDMYKLIHQLTIEESLDPKTLPGSKTDGLAFLYKQPAGNTYLSYIINNQLGHNWPAGQGQSQDSDDILFAGLPFISKNSVNFPAYLAQFFKINKKR